MATQESRQRSIRIGNFVFTPGRSTTVSADEYFRQLSDRDQAYMDGERPQRRKPLPTYLDGITREDPKPLPPPTPTAGDSAATQKPQKEPKKEGQIEYPEPDLSGLELTERHIEILGYHARGATRPMISKQLGIATGTIYSQETHIRARVREVFPEGRDPLALAVRHLVREGKIEVENPANTQALTPRQKEIANLLTRGFTQDEIAQTCVIEPKTVETHTLTLKEKIGVRTLMEAVAKLTAAEKLEK